MISRCPSCGSQVADEATRCPSCHWDFIAFKHVPPDGATAATPPAVPAAKTPPPAPPKPKTEPPKKEPAGGFGIPTLPKAGGDAPAPVPGFGIPTLPSMGGGATIEPPDPIKGPFALPTIRPPEPKKEEKAREKTPEPEPVKEGFSIPVSEPDPEAPKPKPVPKAKPSGLPKEASFTPIGEELPSPAQPTPLPARRPYAYAAPPPAPSAADRFKKPEPVPTAPPKKLGGKKLDIPPAVMGFAGGVGVCAVAGLIWFFTRGEAPAPAPAASTESTGAVFAKRDDADAKLDPVQGSPESAAAGGPVEAPPPANEPAVIPHVEPPKSAPAPQIVEAPKPAPAPAPKVVEAPKPDPEAPVMAPPAKVAPQPKPVETPKPAPTPKPVVAEVPKPKPKPAEDKPKAAKTGWVFEGMVYNLMSLQPVYGAKLVFKDSGGEVKGSAITGDEGRYKVNLPAGPAGGYVLEVSHPDFVPKYIDEIDPPFREVGEDYRKQLLDLAPRPRPWVGSTGSATKRDMVMIPKVALSEAAKE